MLALQGITVLDLTGVGPGPFCTMLLGDLGAEVIKIESPPVAMKQKPAGSQSHIDEAERKRIAYHAPNRNKKSIALDLKSEGARNIFYKLAKTAGVIVEGFRPGVVKRLMIDYETMNKINPQIVYCSISGYGQDGPYSNLTGYDINFTGMSGALSLVGKGEPVIPHNLIADIGGGGMSAAVGILAALIASHRTGRGQYIDISLTDSALSLLTAEATHYFQHGTVPKGGETVFGGGYPYFNVYQTKDGKYITIGCLQPRFWQDLCRVIGREDLAPFHVQPEHFLGEGKDAKWEEVSSSLKQLFLTKTRDEWFDMLSQKGIPIGKVYSLDEVANDRQILHREMVVELEHPTEGKIKQIGIAIKLSDTPGKIRTTAPALGEHTTELLLNMGYSNEEIHSLYEKGIIA